MKKVFSLIIVVAMIAAMVIPAMAADPSTPEIIIKTTSDSAEASSDTTAYTWYRILEASIDEDPSQSGATQSNGKVAYYVTTADRAAEINATGLFNVVRVGDTDKWYVELKDKNTTASAIAEKFADMDLSKFVSGSFAQTAVAGTATSGEVAPGYYYITSTAGTEVVIQTLTKVEIDEKNTFPTVDKAIAAEDENAQIGDEINYTATVVIPATANDKIVVTDTMDAALTFKEVSSIKAGETAVTGTVANTTNGFTITFDKATVIANAGKTITIEYVAVLNNKAVVDTDIPNTIKLAYGDNYVTVEKTVITKTYSFDFDKVDADKTKLTGAEFQLTLDGETPIELVEVEAGKTYRIAMSDDAETTDTIVTNGNTITINGLDTDVTYQLVETKAPTSYNKLDGPIEVKASDNVFVHQDVVNNKGTVLPSTGGHGVYWFYGIGGALVAGAVVLLITKKRMSKEQ